MQSNPRAAVEAMPVLCAGMALFEACRAALETACRSAGAQAIDPTLVSDRLHMPDAAAVAAVAVVSAAVAVAEIVVEVVAVAYQTMPGERC